MNKKSSSHLALRALCEGAIFVALAQILGYIKLARLANGGSITLIMLPIFVYCSRWGFAKGMLAAFALSVLQLFDGGGFSIGWQSILGDYILAYSALGLAGLFHNLRYGYFWGTIVGSLARFLVHYVTGATLWGIYMPDRFLGMKMTSPWIYSALYNGSYMLPCMLICLVVGVAYWTPLQRYLTGKDIR